MKKLLILSLFALHFSLSSAQNRHFYYVRFDPQEGNASAIVDEIDRVANTYPYQLIVVLSWGANPKVSTDVESWKSIRSSILTQQNSSTFNAREEEELLNNLFAQQLDERARPNDGKMKLYGPNDSQWSVSFVLSEKMYERQEDYEIVPLEFSKINELTERGISVHWLSYGDGSRLEEHAEPRIPFYE